MAQQISDARKELKSFNSNSYNQETQKLELLIGNNVVLNHWLVGGDRNTQYFHRRERNYILKIQDENGVWVSDP